MNKEALGGVPDFAFLNKPLTSADRAFVPDDAFCETSPGLAPVYGRRCAARETGRRWNGRSSEIEAERRQDRLT